MDLNSADFQYLESVDFESQRVIATQNAQEEHMNSDGLQPPTVCRRRILPVEEDDDDSEIEVTNPRRRQNAEVTDGKNRASQVNKRGKNLFQTTLDGKEKSSQLKKRKTKVVDVEDDDAETEFRSEQRKSTRHEVNNGKGIAFKVNKRKKKMLEPQPSQQSKKKRKMVESDDESDSDDDDAETDKGKSADKKKSKESRKWSEVWDDFVVITKKDGSQKAQCTHCKKEYKHESHKNGTTTLKRHSKRCALTPRTSGDVGKMMINTEAKLQARKIDHFVFREMVAKTIIQHDLPFAYVEYERVRAVWKYLNADVKFISRNTAAADVYRFYENEAANLKMELASLPGRISFTSDLWSSITQEGYMCLTAHYIDRNWKLKNKILAFYAVPPPHTEDESDGEDTILPSFQSIVDDEDYEDES